MMLPHLLALLAAVLYAVGALLMKRSSEFGTDVWRTAFVCNLVTALLFQPLLFFGGTMHWDLWWQPVLVALFFILGQWLTFFSLERGDVSVATPVLGLKILLVALFVTVLGSQSLRPQLWAAAGLATAGIALLNRRPAQGHHHQIGLTILSAASAAAAYALFDVLVQKWSPIWGLGRFLPLTIGLSGVLSFAFILRFPAPLKATSRSAWPWLAGGALAIGGQSLIFVFTVAYWRQAAQANVVYSSRGLCSVLLVWLVGHWVQSREKNLGKHVLAWRLAGATLMMSAILLVLLH